MTMKWISYARTLGLHGSPQVVAMVLATHANAGGTATLPWSQIAREGGLNRVTVYRALQFLLELGIVEWEPGGGRAVNIYRLLSRSSMTRQRLQNVTVGRSPTVASHK